MEPVLSAANSAAARNSQERFALIVFVFQVPCVGVSIGIERIFSILEAKAEVTINSFEKQLFPYLRMRY